MQNAEKKQEKEKNKKHFARTDGPRTVQKAYNMYRSAAWASGPAS
jgi:hypothetical protein